MYTKLRRFSGINNVVYELGQLILNNFQTMLPQQELLQEVPGGFANFIKVFKNESESICC